MTSVDLPLVSFRYVYRFADGTVIPLDSTLRFRSRAAEEAFLRVAGFSVVEVRDPRDRPGGEDVFIARRASG